MKVIKVALGASLLAFTLLYSGCKKKEPNVEPVADTETQSAVDAMWATFVITDVDQICAFMEEGQGLLLQHFYTPSSCSSGTVDVQAQPSANQLTMAYDNALCLDGHRRRGTILLFNNQPNEKGVVNPNSKYYRDYEFAARLGFSDFYVDGWKIDFFNAGVPAYIYNKVSPENYDAKTVKLKWKIAGKFLLKHPTDSTKNIIWDGVLYKTLFNSTDKDIFDPGKQLPISWVNVAKNKTAYIQYYGTVSGTVNNKTFKLEIDQATPLVRDFSCAPDPVSCVATTGTGSVTTININKEEFHPFIKGIASFTYGTTSDNIYPRQIYCGNEGLSDQSEQCDNTGIVMIKGISYKVNFRK